MVLLFAAEYPLSNYVLFIESLRATGYSGDIVLSVNREETSLSVSISYNVMDVTAETIVNR